MKDIIIDPIIFRELKYEIKVSIVTTSLCCCGYENCDDPDCHDDDLTKQTKAA